MAEPPQPAATPPPRAFTQGVGTVFQSVGVVLFVLSMFVCCSSSLLGKPAMTNQQLTSIGWRIGGGLYSAQRALAACMLAAIFFGLALAGIGLGLQAQSRRAPMLATVVTALATPFWLVHTMFFADAMRSIALVALCGVFSLTFLALLVLSISALREYRREPPPRGLEILPPDYQVPYSHLHQDPPEVRLARELNSRREKLAVQQKELEMLEERLRRKVKQSD